MTRLPRTVLRFLAANQVLESTLLFILTRFLFLVQWVDRMVLYGATEECGAQAVLQKNWPHCGVVLRRFYGKTKNTTTMSVRDVMYVIHAFEHRAVFQNGAQKNLDLRYVFHLSCLGEARLESSIKHLNAHLIYRYVTRSVVPYLAERGITGQ